MEWVDITEEMMTEEVQVSSETDALIYLHKFGPVMVLAHNRRVVALSGLKSGNYKAEIEYVEGSKDMTVRVFMRDPALIFTRKVE